MDTAQEVGGGVGWGAAGRLRSHTRMKSPWLANFWCSGMVENTDSTKQLKTSRKLEGADEKQDSPLTPSFIKQVELTGN